MIDELSHFDAPTAIAVGVNSVTATLNSRKEFLVDLGVLNKIGLQQDGITIRESDEVRIGELSLRAINTRLRQQGVGELTLIPTSTFRRKMGTDYRKLSRTDLKLINPAPIPRLLGDKAQQYWELYETTLPVPPWQPLDYYIDSTGKLDTQTLKADFIPDAPLVVKARNATQGQGIWFYPDGITTLRNDWLQKRAPDAFLSNPEEYLLQYAVPHVYDKRILAAGGTPVSGEDRYGRSDTDKSNLNLVNVDGSSPREVAIELLKKGAVEPLAMDRLDPAVETIVADVYDALVDLSEHTADTMPTWIGWDFLVVDPNDDRLDAIPSDVVDGLLKDRYRMEEGPYLVFGEGNLSPGSKERYVNAIANGRKGLCWDSAANLLAYGISISQDEPFEPGIPDVIDEDTLATRYGLEPRINTS
ncbi:MAG: hypothetical protein ABEI06_01720 [Halobacteriaceae archaeon]